MRDTYMRDASSRLESIKTILRRAIREEREDASVERAFDQLPVGFVRGNAKSGCTYVNKFLLDFYRLTEEEFLGLGYQRVIHEADRLRIMDSFFGFIQGSSLLWVDEMRVYAVDGIRTIDALVRRIGKSRYVGVIVPRREATRARCSQGCSSELTTPTVVDNVSETSRGWVRYSCEQGILIVEYSPELKAGLAVVQESMRRRREMGKGAKVPQLVFAHSVYQGTPEAHRFCCQSPYADTVLCNAVVLDRPFSVQMANLLVRRYGPPYPMRCFRTRREAIAWIARIRAKRNIEPEARRATDAADGEQGEM